MKLYLEADKKKKERERQFCEGEFERNRQYKLQIAEVYARAFACIIRPTNPGNYFPTTKHRDINQVPS